MSLLSGCADELCIDRNFEATNTMRSGLAAAASLAALVVLVIASTAAARSVECGGGTTCNEVPSDDGVACDNGGTYDAETGLCHCPGDADCTTPDCQCRDCGEHGNVTGDASDRCVCEEDWAEDPSTGRCSLYQPAEQSSQSSEGTLLSRGPARIFDRDFYALDNFMRAACAVNCGLCLWFIKCLMPG